MQLQQEKDKSVQYRKVLKLLHTYSIGTKGMGDPLAPPLKSRQVRNLLNVHRIIEAYKPGKKVAFVGEQFPGEILLSMGIIPWNIESMNILLANTLEGYGEILMISQENSLTRDICSFLRGPYGMMMANYYPTPNLVVSSDQPCHPLAKLGNIASKLYECPYYMLNVPTEITNDAITYVVKQFREVIELAEHTFGVSFDQERFTEIIRHTNKTIEFMEKTNDLLKKYRIPYISREIHEIFGMNYFGLKENADLCEGLYEDALELVKSGQIEEKKRIMWIGQNLPETHELIRYLDEQVNIIYWAPLWEGTYVHVGEEKPLEDIALRAILYHWHDQRFRIQLKDLLRDYAVDGIILANVWGCRNMMGIGPSLKTEASGVGVKSITINIDAIDKNNFSFINLKNRIDAFLEIL